MARWDLTFLFFNADAFNPPVKFRSRDKINLNAYKCIFNLCNVYVLNY